METAPAPVPETIPPVDADSTVKVEKTYRYNTIDFWRYKLETAGIDKSVITAEGEKPKLKYLRDLAEKNNIKATNEEKASLFSKKDELAKPKEKKDKKTKPKKTKKEDDEEVEEPEKFNFEDDEDLVSDSGLLNPPGKKAEKKVEIPEISGTYIPEEIDIELLENKNILSAIIIDGLRITGNLYGRTIVLE